MSEKYKSEYAPIWRDVKRFPPPIGTKILLRSQYGTAIIGQYYAEGNFTHWTGLPKLSDEEKNQEPRACG